MLSFRLISKLLVVAVAAFCLAGVAFAERECATPQIGGTVTLFGIPYSVNGINVRTTVWPGTGILDGSGPGGIQWNCGMEVGFYQGADTFDDRILLPEECDSGGEIGLIVTGVQASPSYEPSVAVSTASFIMNNTGATPMDPTGIEWISDANVGGSKTDINYRAILGVNGHLTAYDSTDFPMNQWSANTPPGPWEVDWDQWAAYKGIAGCKNDKTGAATRMYLGAGVRGGSPHFGYGTFDLTSNSFVNQFSVWLDGIGVPDEIDHDGLNHFRDLRGMAYDGIGHYYMMVKKPGTGTHNAVAPFGECWLYRYNSLPDPGVADGPHPDGSPLSSQLDTATGVCWPSGINRPDRAGIACGRIHNGHPVFYVLCNQYLYTLVPQVAADENWQMH